MIKVQHVLTTFQGDLTDNINRYLVQFQQAYLST